jgi:hypothetical protein
VLEKEDRRLKMIGAILKLDKVILPESFDF